MRREGVWGDNPTHAMKPHEWGTRRGRNTGILHLRSE
jgi:hypothetical protein